MKLEKLQRESRKLTEFSRFPKERDKYRKGESMEYDKTKGKAETVLNEAALVEHSESGNLDYCTMPHDAENSRAWNPDDACDDCVR
jgi:hypothetical protein